MRDIKIRVMVLIIIFISMSFSIIAGEIISVDLNTAVNNALENDLDFKIATINFEKAELEYEKKKANYLLQQSRYNELEMESSYNSAKNIYRNSKNQLINSVITGYTGLWLADLDLQIKNINFQLEEIRLEEAEAQYQIGDIGSIDLLDRENSYKDAQFNLEIANDDYQQDIKEFAIKLNLEGKELELASISYSENWQMSEEELINAILENSFDLRSKKDQITLAEIDLERACVSSPELDRKAIKKNLEIAKLELEKNREELIKDTQQSFYQFKRAVKRIELNEERLKGAEEKYKLREEQYMAGLITRIEVLEYEASMLQARYNYLSAVADYYLQKQILRQNMGLGAEVLLDNEKK